jgi:hypothetical protein
MPRIFIFGLGYTAKRIEAALVPQGWEVIATGSDGALSFGDSGNVRLALADSSHVLSSVPPNGEGLDPVLEAYAASLTGKWLGYLSSTGVYGDTGGAWIDESAHSVGFGGGQGRRTARAEADAQWLALGARVFRLPGIYGPGRSALDRVRAGKAHRIDVPDQVFSRVHVEDIASGVIAALGASAGAYNLPSQLGDRGGLPPARPPAAGTAFAGASEPFGHGAKLLWREPPGGEWQGQACARLAPAL